MSKLSEEYYCSGWLVDLEYTLWDVLQGNEQAFAAGALKDEEIQKLRELSDLCGGWIYWNKQDNETFIPLEAWKTWYAAWKADD